MVRRAHIAGARGDWTAVVEGRRLAVLYPTWRIGMTGCRGPMSGAKSERQRYAACLAALTSENLVVVRKDKPETLERGGYVSVFTFKDLVVEKSAAASLTLVARPADPK